MSDIQDLEPATQIELEAAAFRTLIAHLRERTDVQNIDLMNLSGFCRNCLSKYYVAAAKERGIELEYEDARTRVYGEPYASWNCLLYTSPSPRDRQKSRMPSSA